MTPQGHDIFQRQIARKWYDTELEFRRAFRRILRLDARSEAATGSQAGGGGTTAARNRDIERSRLHSLSGFM